METPTTSIDDMADSALREDPLALLAREMEADGYRATHIPGPGYDLLALKRDATYDNDGRFVRIERRRGARLTVEATNRESALGLVTALQCLDMADAAPLVEGYTYEQLIGTLLYAMMRPGVRRVAYTPQLERAAMAYASSGLKVDIQPTTDTISMPHEGGRAANLP